MNNDAAEPLTPLRQIFAAIKEDDPRRVEELLRDYPELENYGSDTNPNLLHAAASYGSQSVARWLIDRGMDVNQMDSKGHSCALQTAISEDDLGMVRLLLEHGADPNQGRTLFRAIRSRDEELGLTIAKLLVEHGVDVTTKFKGPGSSETDAIEYAEDYGKERIAAYLRSVVGSSGGSSEASPTAAKSTPTDPILDHFSKQFGPVAEKSIQEIVPGGLPLAIHVIKPTSTHRHVTFFTRGMSDRPMVVPRVNIDGFDAKEYRFAELVMHLPPDWPLEMSSLKKMEYGWPIVWLRKMARYPHENQTWLGGPVTVFTETDPPTPLWPGSKFVALLLFAKSEIKLPDGKLIQEYFVTPLYQSEFDLERREGISELFVALDQANIESAFDPNRPSAG